MNKTYRVRVQIELELGFEAEDIDGAIAQAEDEILPNTYVEDSFKVLSVKEV